MTEARLMAKPRRAARDASNKSYLHSLARANCPVACVVDNEIDGTHRYERHQRDYIAPRDAVLYEAGGSYIKAETARLERHCHIIHSAQCPHENRNYRRDVTLHSLQQISLVKLV